MYQFPAGVNHFKCKTRTKANTYIGAILKVFEKNCFSSECMNKPFPQNAFKQTFFIQNVCLGVSIEQQGPISPTVGDPQGPASLHKGLPSEIILIFIYVFVYLDIFLAINLNLISFARIKKLSSSIHFDLYAIHLLSIGLFSFSYWDILN